MFIAYEQNDVHEENVAVDYTKIHTAQRDDVKLKKLQTDPNKKEFYATKMYKKIQIR